MTHQTFLRLAVCLVFTPSLIVSAQVNSDVHKQSPPAKAKSTSKTSKSSEPDAIVAQRRVVAVSLLTTLADEARSFRDQTRRARVQAQAADALWEVDEERSRDLFRRAWEAAELADSETAKQQLEDLRKQSASGPVVLRARPEVRNDVLRLVARRDAKLGEEFLKDLSEASEREANEAAAEFRRNSLNTFNATAGAARRLRLARQLLDDGDVERAIRFADPVLNQVNVDSIFFLSALRTKNSGAADAFFISLLERVAHSPAADANSVAGLSSYLFTPFLYVTFQADGGSNAQQQRAGISPPADVPPRLRDSFLRVAAMILLRPSPPPDQDQTTAGRAGKYMVIKRLLPLFEQYAPQSAADLRTQMAALTADVPERLRTGENRAVTRGIVPEDTSVDPRQRMQERLDRARTSEERDIIYADYAVALAGNGDNYGRELVDKIEDTELRKRVRAHTDFQWAQSAIRNKDAEEAARAAKNGELTGIQRVWAYTRAARLLMNSDRSRATQLLEDAGTEARRIGSSDSDRARALVAVATVLAEVDRVRTWETVAEAVKAANSSEGFTGEDSSLSARIQTKQMVEVTNVAAEDFDLVGAFKWMARDDLLRSIEQAKGFTGETPRAVAILAIARAVLENKSREDRTPPGQ